MLNSISGFIIAITMWLNLLIGGSSLINISDKVSDVIVPMDMQLSSAIPQSSFQMAQSGGLGWQLVIASMTTLLSLVVYVVGQIITKFIIEPIHEQKQTIGQIADAIVYYANRYFDKSNLMFVIKNSEHEHESPEERSHRLMASVKEDEKTDEVYNKIRGLGTLLLSKTHSIPRYNLFAYLHWVEPMKDIVEAHKGLIGLANSLSMKDINDRNKFENQIRNALNLYNPKS